MNNEKCGMNTNFVRRPSCEDKTSTLNNSKTGGCKPESVNDGDLVFIKREGKNFIFSQYGGVYQPFANVYASGNRIFYTDSTCKIREFKVDIPQGYTPPAPFVATARKKYTRTNHYFGHNHKINVGSRIIVPRTGVYNLHITGTLKAICTCASNPQEGKRRMGATLAYTLNGSFRTIGYIGDATDITPINNSGGTAGGTDILSPAGQGGTVVKLNKGDRIQFMIKETVLRSESPEKVSVSVFASIGIN